MNQGQIEYMVMPTSPDPQGVSNLWLEVKAALKNIPDVEITGQIGSPPTVLLLKGPRSSVRQLAEKFSSRVIFEENQALGY